MQAAILAIGYAICAAAYLLLGGLLALSKRKSNYHLILGLSAAFTFLWAFATAARGWLDIPPAGLIALELSRTTCWIVFVAMLIGSTGGNATRDPRLLLSAAIVAACLTVIGVETSQIFSIDLIEDQSALLAEGVAFMSLAIIGLLLLENLFRNSSSDAKWGVKFLCFGLGAIFAYDFFNYAEAVLFRSFDRPLILARGYVNALAAPMIAVAVTRAHSWSVDIHVSRNVVFQSAALIACGLYLLVMSAAGFYVREFGGDWGSVFQITFSVGALFLLFILFSSGTLRDQARLFIARNFFSTRYDYRQEWLRFIGTVSSNDRGATLQERIMFALAQIVDSKAAALWILNKEERCYEVAASWNFGEDLPREHYESELIRQLNTTPTTTLAKDIRNALAGGNSAIGTWLVGEKDAWLVLPLYYRNSLCAVLILGRSRSRQEIDWQDSELLETIGRQAASYLTEEQATNALIESAQFKEFNKRFAFVAHDIKNILNQLSLLIRNAENHADKPEFQADMLATVSSSVTRMTQLLAQLKDSERLNPSPGSTQTDVFDLCSCMEKLGQAWKKNEESIHLEFDSKSVSVRGDQSQLESAVGHLLQNAIDAVGQEGTVSLRTRANETHVSVEVEDDGPGMNKEFVRTHLFQPMHSTKGDGFGVGVFQVRQYVRDMGGELKVETSPGDGTTMEIVLPIAKPS